MCKYCDGWNQTIETSIFNILYVQVLDARFVLRNASQTSSFPSVPKICGCYLNPWCCKFTVSVGNHQKQFCMVDRHIGHWTLHNHMLLVNQLWKVAFIKARLQPNSPLANSTSIGHEVTVVMILIFALNCSGGKRFEIVICKFSRT